MPRTLAEFDISEWTFGGDITRLRPSLALLAFSTIELTSATEMVYQSMLSSILHTTPEIAMAMLQGIQVEDTRRKVVIAALRNVCPDEDALLFDAVHALKDSARAKRNIFAHDLWGYTSQVDGLLTVHPSHFLEFNGKSHAWRNKVDAGQHPGDLVQLPEDKILVWQLEDLTRAKEEAFDAFRAVSEFSSLVGARFSSDGDRYRSLALAIPAVKSAFEVAKEKATQEAAKLAARTARSRRTPPEERSLKRDPRRRN